MYKYKLQTKDEVIDDLLKFKNNNKTNKKRKENYLFKAFKSLKQFKAIKINQNDLTDDCPYREDFVCKSRNCNCLVIKSEKFIPLDYYINDNHLIFTLATTNYTMM